MKKSFMKTQSIFLLLIALSILFSSFLMKHQNHSPFMTVLSPIIGGSSDSPSPNRRAFEELHNTEAMVEKINIELVGALYNFTPSTLRSSSNKINALTYHGDVSLENKITPATRKLNVYRSEIVEKGKGYAVNNTTLLYGIEELIRVSYTENGEEKREILRVNLAYVPTIKTFKILSIDITP